MKFRAKIELHGKTATGIVVPLEVVESLNSGKRPPVCVTINGHTYRSTVAPMAGEFRLPISAEHRTRSGVEAGDEVEVEIEPDKEPREVDVPPDLLEALECDADAKRFFDGLSSSNKQRIVLSIEGAKTTETRLRRITKAISELHEGRA
ncbi:YdeI/OmpD-associated family protein [Dictyobacter formicarum]|uniref:DUF1905 domain-containing protein n=1 Tax=Dictyobacter formicarum TaxID=2778368 RepID=A0ABQ3VQH1_9CHLR|nr:hypothetical protein KSZ_60710 [Dictyobacter formicarum]